MFAPENLIFFCDALSHYPAQSVRRGFSSAVLTELTFIQDGYVTFTFWSIVAIVLLRIRFNCLPSSSEYELLLMNETNVRDEICVLDTDLLSALVKDYKAKICPLCLIN
jgi:hypothetical protein